MKLDPKSTGIFTLDLQHGIIAMVTGSEAVLSNAAKAVGAARKAGHHIYHVGLGFSPGHPEISARNSRFAGVKAANGVVRGTEQTKFHPDIYRDGDTTITKYRVSGFAGSTLAMVLRAQEIETMVLFGISSSGIVLSTVREAADLDYKLIVVKDACFDRDPEVHRVLTEKIFPTQATVVTVDEFAAML